MADDSGDASSLQLLSQPSDVVSNCDEPESSSHSSAEDSDSADESFTLKDISPTIKIRLDQLKRWAKKLGIATLRSHADLGPRRNLAMGSTLARDLQRGEDRSPDPVQETRHDQLPQKPA